MESFVSTFSQQLRHAAEIGSAADLAVLAAWPRPHHVVVAGVGGSGIGGDVVRGIVLDRLPIPLSVVRTYTVPAFVGPDTLFIASSFSGDTEETLAAVDAAQARGARIVAITSGGGLLARAEQHGWPTVRIPGESKLPRANVGYSLVQLLFVLRATGLLGDEFQAELADAIVLLESHQEGVQREARDLAHALSDHLPIIYADARLEAVALRFRQQLNENANQLALVNTFSEMNHNEIVGWENPPAVLARTAVVLLRTPLDHPRVAVRMELCAPVFAAHAASVTTVDARGGSALAQALYLIQLLDWASVFTARLNGADPLTVPAIDELKARLAERT
ncbi:MAG: bifunctional phosphoglucose/phosphomannose isomerase [Hymenobacteraceae bacterium]|nr:bifunctional phosphoglucose/phosphomannose isomerase [Hymenobacteraceae bacterium]